MHIEPCVPARAVRRRHSDGHVGAGPGDKPAQQRSTAVDLRDFFRAVGEEIGRDAVDNLRLTPAERVIGIARRRAGFDGGAELVLSVIG